MYLEPAMDNLCLLDCFSDSDFFHSQPWHRGPAGRTCLSRDSALLRICGSILLPVRRAFFVQERDQECSMTILRRPLPLMHRHLTRKNIIIIIP